MKNKGIILNLGLYAFVFGVVFVIYQAFFNPTNNTSLSEEQSIVLVDRSNFSEKIYDDVNKTLPQSEIVSFGYGLRMYDQNKTFISYDDLVSEGDSYSFYASLVNATPKNDKIGFLVLIDGIAQDFIVDRGHATQNLYTSELAPYSFINVPIHIKHFKTAEYKTGKHTLTLIMIYQFDDVPTVEKMFIDFYLNTLHKDLTISSQASLNSQVIKFIPGIIDNQSSEEHITGVYLTLLGSDSEKTREVVVGMDNSIYISGKAPQGKYSSILIINDKIHTQFFWELKNNGDQLHHSVTISNGILVDQTKTAYVITVPIAPYIPYAFGSTRQKIYRVPENVED